MEKQLLGKTCVFQTNVRMVTNKYGEPAPQWDDVEAFTKDDIKQASDLFKCYRHDQESFRRDHISEWQLFKMYCVLHKDQLYDTNVWEDWFYEYCFQDVTKI